MVKKVAKGEWEKVARTMRLPKGEEQLLFEESLGRWRLLGLAKSLQGEGMSQSIIESSVAQKGKIGVALHCPLQDTI